MSKETLILTELDKKRLLRVKIAGILFPLTLNITYFLSLFQLIPDYLMLISCILIAWVLIETNHFTFGLKDKENIDDGNMALSCKICRNIIKLNWAIAVITTIIFIILTAEFTKTTVHFLALALILHLIFKVYLFNRWKEEEEKYDIDYC